MIDIAYVPTMCNHCDDAPCIKAAKDGAITKRDGRHCHHRPGEGQRAERNSSKPAPYGHNLVETRRSNCRSTGRFDAHLIDQGWQQTRGHQSCPTGAMRAIKRDDAEMGAHSGAKRAWKSSGRTSAPSRGSTIVTCGATTKCFIGGTVFG